MQSSNTERIISCVHTDYFIIRSVFYPLEKEGFQVVPYTTYTAALDNRIQIGNSDVLVLDTLLAAGRNSSEAILREDPYRLGIRFLKELRAGGHQLPAIFLTSKIMMDRAEVDPAEIERLNATRIPIPVLPSQLRKHVLNRLGLPW